jgi:hypothetical protein
MNSTAVKINLSYAAHDLAAGFKADRHAYVNTLAIYAVDQYLQRLQFQTNLTNQQAWWQQSLLNSAPLKVTNIGQIECIAVMPGVTIAEIPSAAIDQRVGYVFVQMDESLKNAEILGFTKKYSAEIALNKLAPLDDLIDYLCDLETLPIAAPVIKLGEWLAGKITAGWQEVEALIMPEPWIYSYRRSVNPVAALNKISQGLPVIFGDTPDDLSVSLIVNILQISNADYEVQIRIYPQNPPNSTLPTGLKFTVADDQGQKVYTSETEKEDVWREAILNAQNGEKFSIALEIDGTEIVKYFEV